MQQFKSAYNFEIVTSDDVYYVFATIMSRADTAITFDLWCPENPLFTKRFTAPFVYSEGDYLQQFIRHILDENDIAGVVNVFG